MRFVFLPVLAVLAACGAAEPAHEGAGHEAAPTEAAPTEAAPTEAAPTEAAPAAAAGPRVFFSEPADGAKLKSPFKIGFGVEGMEVKPAGELVENTGHHHLIINGSSVEQGQMVPKDEKHIHYGGGQTEAELTLDPGEYTLTMQFADGNHMSYGAPMSTTIKVTVE